MKSVGIGCLAWRRMKEDIYIAKRTLELTEKYGEQLNAVRQKAAGEHYDVKPGEKIVNKLNI